MPLVAAVDELLRGSGLARDRVVVNRRLLAGPVGDDALEHRRQPGGGVLADGAPEHLARHGQADAVLDHGAHDARLDQFTAVGDRADRAHHLQRRHADLIADQRGRKRAVGHRGPVPQDAGVLTAEVGRERASEAEPAHVAAEPFGAEPEADLDGTDVAGFLRSIELVAMVVLGGMGSILGSLVGAVLLVVLPQALTIFHEYEQSLLGLILIVFMIFLRRGIVPSVAAIFAGWRK